MYTSPAGRPCKAFSHKQTCRGVIAQTAPLVGGGRVTTGGLVGDLAAGLACAGTASSDMQGPTAIVVVIVGQASGQDLVVVLVVVPLQLSSVVMVVVLLVGLVTVLV